MSIVCDFFIIITRNQTTCGTDEIFRRKEMGTRYTKPIQHGMDGSNCKEYQCTGHRPVLQGTKTFQFHLHTLHLWENALSCLFTKFYYSSARKKYPT